MPLHLIKLCVGVDSLSDLAAWQAQRLDEQRRAQQTPELIHLTRHMPKRSEAILSGGSLYWVVKGWITARQRVLALRRTEKNGVPHCALVFDADLVAVKPRARRPFQGWRYLPEGDAPPDIGRRSADGDLSEELRRELVSLGLL
jgi:hypothetical protein